MPRDARSADSRAGCDCAALRARGVTPTGGVHCQCTRHGVSSPATMHAASCTDAARGTERSSLRSDDERMPRSLARPLALALVALVVAAPLTPASAAAHTARATAIRAEWAWPVWPFRLAEPYRQPAHRFAAGHRGLDLLPAGSDEIRAPSSGTLAFVGEVAGRHLVTIDHGDGLVTTLEPVESELRVGAAVDRGDVVGVLSYGGHTRPGTVHFGVRLHGEYINPLLLMGSLPRAVLLPCCG